MLYLIILALAQVHSGTLDFGISARDHLDGLRSLAYAPRRNHPVDPLPALCASTLVLFGASSDYVHGVTKVRSGLRYTYAGWFTFDAAWEDKEAKLIY